MEDREKNLIRESNLAKWIEKNPADWEKVCGLRFATIKEMRRLMKALEENGFVELSLLMATKWYAARIDLEEKTSKY